MTHCSYSPNWLLYNTKQVYPKPLSTIRNNPLIHNTCGLIGTLIQQPKGDELLVVYCKAKLYSLMGVASTDLILSNTKVGYNEQYVDELPK